MKFLLDTDICIGALRGGQGIIERLTKLAPSDCAVSSITVYELFCGVRKARDPEAERQKVERFLSMVAIIPFDQITADFASGIRNVLESKGTPIGPYDLLIGGQALASNLILVTANISEFQRIADLRIESWPF